MYYLKYLESKYRYSAPNLPHPLLVIESDDWGFQRIPSKIVKERIEGFNNRWVANPYLQYDSLESENDINELSNLLLKIKDCDGNSCIMTANFIMENPDYEKIRKVNFTKFVGKPFIDTYRTNPGSFGVLSLQKKAYLEGIFVPQFHGKHHVNVKRWMESLKSKEPLTHRAFENEMISFQLQNQSGKIPCVSSFLDAMNPCNSDHLTQIVTYCEEGLDIFEKIWGFRSKTMIPPCYIWHSNMESKLQHKGVFAFQGQRLQRESSLTSNPQKFKRKYHYQGEKNAAGQRYFLREAFFEPSLNSNVDWVNYSFRQVDKAIRKQGFAILCSHRLNFMGQLNVVNREKNLKLFELLLKKIITKRPDIRFASSLQLLQYYSS